MQKPRATTGNSSGKTVAKKKRNHKQPSELLPDIPLPGLSWKSSVRNAPVCPSTISFLLSRFLLFCSSAAQLLFFYLADTIAIYVRHCLFLPANPNSYSTRHNSCGNQAFHFRNIRQYPFHQAVLNPMNFEHLSRLIFIVST